MFGARRAAENYEKLEKLVHIVGLEKERLRLEWISAAESIKFANVIREMVDQIKKLGPSPLRDGKEKVKKELVIEGI
jgi:F420-non-reducing hydrogenase iron-sulfur subunit